MKGGADLLAAYLRQRLEDGRADTAPRIPRRPPGDRVPASYGQRQVWLHSRLAPGVPVYSEPITIHRHGALDVGALERALGEIVRRHEAWRTTFTVDDGELFQVVGPPSAITLPVQDLRALPSDAREPAALALATAEALRPFDLGRGPLLRPLLVRLDDAEHRLFLALHHIIFDGVSIYRVLLPELTALYAAFAAGQPSPLPEPPIQYADYALWHRRWVEGGAAAVQLAYWRRQLAGSPPLQLPTDHPRPPVPRFRGAMKTLTLSARLRDRLTALSRREGVTPFMTLLAAFATLLSRYAAQEDVVVGTVTAGRKRPEVERLLGYFLNPLALRLDLSGEPTFRELLARVRDVTLEALANDDVPFEHVVDAVPAARDPGRNPLFQVAFSMEPPMPALEPGWDLTQLDIETGAAKFDLYLELDDRPDGMVGRFMYRVDLFARATIERVAGHFQTLLEGIVADPGRRLSALPLLTDAERHRLLVEWNDTRRDYPAESTVHRLFEARAALAPQAPALVAGDRVVTYGALNARANQLARRLRAAGAGEEARVGVCLERSVDMVVALLAVLKAGAAYVPLDPGYPDAVLGFMLEEARVAAVLTRRALLPRQRTGAPALCLDAERDALARESAENLDADGNGGTLAYAMFTSGSTGRPKGVAIPHRAIVRLLLGVDYVHLGPDETLLQMAPISFDASTFEIWGALLHGGRCVLFPGEIPTHRALRDTLRRHGVTTVWLTASLFNAVIDQAPDALAGVRQLLVGGEALSVPHVRRAFALLPGTRIINGYGPTESATFACCYPIPALPDPERSIPIGRPIANTRVYVLDRHADPVPIGVPGELHIGGAGLAHGYLHRPDLTAEKFVANALDTGRLYRTGDLVRFLPDGNLEFLGRLDAQVKIRGFRIEPAGIEATLREHSAVRDAAVVAREDDGAGRQLVAYVVPEDGAPDVAGLRQFLGARLPPYSVPSAIVALDALPLTPSGKVDRRALPAPRAQAGATALAGRDPLECRLTQLWEELLGVPSVGVRDDFFELGGHSLLAVRMMADIERIFGITLPLAALYDNRTVERLAGALLHHERGAFTAPVVSVNAAGPKRPFFFFHGDLNGGGFYSLGLARRLGDDRPVHAVHPLGLDGGAVPASIEAMAAAHLAAIRRLQPAGPYLLGGYCNGALVAYEVARVLAAQGERTDLVVLIAAAADTRFRHLRTLAEKVTAALGLPPAGAARGFARVRWLATRVARLDTRARIPFLVRTARRRLGATEGTPPGPPRSGDTLCRATTFTLYFRAAMAYVPGPYEGPVLVFWPAEQAGARSGDPSLGWRRVARHVEVRTLPASHNTIVTRHIDVIAEAIRAALPGG